MKTINIFFISGKQLQLTVSDADRNKFIDWMNDVNSCKIFNILQSDLIYSICKDKIEYVTY